MDYYEELGLHPSATHDEVRHACRTLARLLHPDRQQDSELRPHAERQMRRLNEIAELLSDTRRRAAYDATLTRPARRQRRVRRLLVSRAATAVWSSALSLAAVSLFLYFRDDVSARPLASRVTFEHRAAPDSLQREIQSLRRELRRLEKQLGGVQ